MKAWTIKTQTYDPELAVEIVADERTKGYTAWLEDEEGRTVDEESLITDGGVATKRTRRFLLGHLWLPVSLFFT